ncbi:MAG TPA: hypothetical protein VHV31_16750, partial [Nitrolancea sp.]|nr:hypothetical protein [Nitrolancea sp.]
MSDVRSFSLGASLTTVATLGFALWILLHPVSFGMMDWVSNVAQFVLPFLLLVLVAWQAIALVRRPDRPALGRLFWSSFAIWLGVAFFLAGQFIWIINEEILHVSTFPSWSDVGFLGQYPCLFLAIFLLPGRRNSPLARFQLVLDGAI